MTREVVNLQTQLSKLPPNRDDCPNPCALTREEGRPRDLDDLCAGCEVARQLEFFRAGYDEEVSARGLSTDYSFATLYADVSRAMKIADAKRHGYPRECSALEARLLDIVRQERMRPERVSNYELRLKLESKGDS